MAPHFKYRSLVVPEPPPEDISEEIHKVRSMSWAQRLKRVFGIDVEICSKCGGKNKVIAAIEDPKVYWLSQRYYQWPAGAPLNSHLTLG